MKVRRFLSQLLVCLFPFCSHPLQLILCHRSVFSQICWVQSYCKIPVFAEYSRIVAFATPPDLFSLPRMFLGLRNTLYVFPGFIGGIARYLGFHGVYLDDSLITLPKCHNVTQLFERASGCQIATNHDMCKIDMTELKPPSRVNGHIIKPRFIHDYWVFPVSNLKIFLHLMNYRPFPSGTAERLTTPT